MNNVKVMINNGGAISQIVSNIDDFKVEVQVYPKYELSDQEKDKAYFNEMIAELEKQIQQDNDLILKLNHEIDRLTNHADSLDYTVAVGSGIIAGIVDSLWVGEFSITDANEFGKEKVDSFVIKIAQAKGYKDNDLLGAVRYLETNFELAADKATNDFGGGLQHHLRDFSHHASIVGLFFSLLTQFTKNVYGTNTSGIFCVVPLKEKDMYLIGNTIPEKFTLGVVNWFFHMVSDIAGSSTSIAEGKLGTGVPGPILSLLKEVSALPIFKKANEKGYKEFSVWVSKLFNGTLLGDAQNPVKFDLRSEIGVAKELSKEAVPVILNECIVRGFYFIRRLSTEFKNKNITSFKDLKKIDLKTVLPFNNRTIVRMVTISSGTFTAMDIADATIRSAVKNGGVQNPLFIKDMILRVNFVGVGRFAIAVGTDLSMGHKRNKKRNERIKVYSHLLSTYNVQLLCYNGIEFISIEKMWDTDASMWISAKQLAEKELELYLQIETTAKEVTKFRHHEEKTFDEIKQIGNKIRENNPDFLEDILTYDNEEWW